MLLAAPSQPLGSNDIKGLIDATESEIRRLTSQICELTSALQKERSTLAGLWLMVTPIGKAPTEILVEIFMHSAQAALSESLENFDAPIGPCHPTRQILLLCNVCPYWRQIIINTPRLWNVGVIDVRLPTRKYDATAAIFGLETVLKRSAPLPISVSLTKDVGAFPVFDTRVIEPVIQAVAPTAHRWKSLTVDSFASRPLASLPGGTFHALESLDLRYETYAHTFPISTFFPAPQLRRLALSIEGESSEILMPWAQLTDLKLEHSSLSCCLRILLQCPQLVSAEFITSEWDFDNDAEVPTAVLPILETLKMRFDAGSHDDGHVEPFFEPLTLPILHTLDLTFDPSPGVVWSTNEFSAFQRRSPHITHIALKNCPITSAELTSLLQLAPAATTLNLKYCLQCIDDEFMRVLTCDADGRTEPLAPQLRQLDWDGVGYHFSDQRLEAAIRSRWWTDTKERDFVRLEKVSISRYSGDSMSGEFIDRMKDLVEQGLDLTSEFPEY